MVKRSTLAAVALTGIAAVSASAQTAEVRERVACVSVAPGVTAFKATTVDGQPGEHRILLRKADGAEGAVAVATRGELIAEGATRVAIEASAGQGGVVSFVNKNGEVTTTKLPEGGGAYRIVKKPDGTVVTEAVTAEEIRELTTEDAKKYKVSRPKAKKPTTDEATARYNVVTVDGRALAETKAVECEKLTATVKKIDQ